jgi:hypothetical protein
MSDALNWMLFTPGQNIQEQSLLARRKSPPSKPLSMHPNPENGGGRKRPPTPYVHPSLQHQTTSTPFHQTDAPNSIPSFSHPTLASIKYYTNNSQEFAPATGSDSCHPSLNVESSHNSTYPEHTRTPQSFYSAHPVPSSNQWPEAGLTIQPQYQMLSKNGRYGEEVGLWDSFLNESTPRPPLGPGGPFELVTPVASAAGEPIQYVFFVVRNPCPI